MDKESSKKWKKETKNCKLKVWMLKRNALAEYCDVVLCGDTNYGRGQICMIIEDSKNVSVMGQMKATV